MRRAVVVLTALLLPAAACGGGGGGGGDAARDAFLDDLEDICRDLKKDLDALEEPTTLGTVASVANSAARVLDKALDDMRSLKVPGGNKTFENDALDLFDNFEARVTALEDVASTALGLDSSAVQTKIDRYTRLETQGNEVADDLGARRCVFDPVFAAGAPPVDTVPPDTLPPDTVPVETTPPVTAPPVDEGNKPSVDLAELLPVLSNGHTFVDISDDLVITWRTLLDLSALMAPQSGTIGGLDMLDQNGITFARAFLFIADGQLADNSVFDLAAVLAGEAPISTVDVSTLSGAQWTSPDGFLNFLTSNQGVVLWILATNATDLEVAVQNLEEAFA